METPLVNVTPASSPAGLEKDTFIDAVRMILNEIDQVIEAKQNVKKKETQMRANARNVTVKADSSPTFKAFERYRRHLTMSIGPEKHKEGWMKVYRENRSKVLNNIDTWLLNKENPIKIMVEEGESKNGKPPIHAELQLTNWYRTADSLPKIMNDGVKKGIREAMYNCFFHLIGQEVRKIPKEKEKEIGELKLEMGTLLKLSNPKIPQAGQSQPKSGIGGVADFFSSLNLTELTQRYINSDRLMKAVNNGNTDIIVEELAGGIQRFSKENNVGINIEDSHIATVKAGAGTFIGEMKKNNGDMAASILNSFKVMSFKTTDENGKTVDMSADILDGVKGLSGNLEQAVKAAKEAAEAQVNSTAKTESTPTESMKSESPVTEPVTKTS